MTEDAIRDLSKIWGCYAKACRFRKVRRADPGPCRCLQGHSAITQFVLGRLFGGDGGEGNGRS